jgi:hypothetical protein
MKYAYTLDGSEVILRDYPVYGAAALQYGALMQLGTTDPDSGADEGQAAVIAYNATAANSGTNVIGMLNEAIALADLVAPSTVVGPKYGKIIINPSAVYRGEISLAAADDIAITSTSTTTLTVASLQDDIDGAFVYFPLTQTGVKGSLRQLVASASGSATMDSALVTTGGASDTIVIIPRELKSPCNLSSDATKFVGSDATAIEGAAKFIILSRLIDADGGVEPIRYARHSGLNNLDQVRGGVKFYLDVIPVDHLFGNA